MHAQRRAARACVVMLVFAIGVAIPATSQAATRQAATAHAATTPITGLRVGWPCTGCLTYIPTTYDAAKPATIVVALHGDEGDPTYIESVFEPAAVKAHAILFAPLCPTALGCRFGNGSGGFTNSWWAWFQSSPQYDDAWIGHQVDAIGQSYVLDPAKEFLTAWSGGADYLGWYALAHGDRFAAAGFVVGGVPYHPACPANHPAAYFLMGSNDFRYLSKQPSQVKSVYDSCGDTTKMVVIKGADHQGTVDALSTKNYASKMVKWLLKHPLA